jgi:hypothetical protein
MKVLVLGDCHGEWTAMNLVIAKAMKEHSDITHIVQVGDFGYAWPGIKPLKLSRSYFTDEELDKLENEIVKLWLDGNHENFTKLVEDCGDWQPGWRWMSRGEVLKIEHYRLMFFGGAESWDRDRRIEGVSWWSDEQITYMQTASALGRGHIDAIFSHEHPSCFSYSDNRYGSDDVSQGAKLSLQALHDEYKPAFWFFGHHHRGDQKLEHDTLWTCCPIVDAGKPLCYTIWTGENADRYWVRNRRQDERKRKPFIT